MLKNIAQRETKNDKNKHKFATILNKKNTTMLEITEQNYEEKIGNTNLPVVLDFGATWCGPCQVIKPYIEKMSNTYEGRAIVAKVDIDEAGDLPMKFGIRNVPTVIYLKGGKVVDRVVGAVPESQLIEKLEAIL